jgi:hypothetical protein
MRIELAIAVAALSVLYVACFEVCERRTAADASRLRTFRAVGGGMLALGTLALLAGALIEHAPPALDQVAIAARGPVPAAMLVEQLVDLLGTLGVFL